MLPLIGYNYAARNYERTERCFRFGTAISLGFALFCVLVYELFAPFLTRLFIDDAQTAGYAASFLRRMVVAMPFMSVCYPLITKFQAMGKAKESLTVSVMRKGVLDIPLYFAMDALVPLYGCMWVQPIVDTVSLTAENNWRYVWDELDAGCRWEVVEKECPGYTVKVEKSGVTFTLTNTHVPSETPPKKPDPAAPKPRLPQTGQLWWPVPLLLQAGLGLLIVGLRQRRKKHEK